MKKYFVFPQIKREYIAGFFGQGLIFGFMTISKLIIAYIFSTGWSFLIMSVLSLYVSYKFIKIYDSTEKDTMYIESLKQGLTLKLSESKLSFLTKVMVWALGWGGRVVVILILIIFEPSATFLFSRKDHHKFDGFEDKIAVSLMILSSSTTSLYCTYGFKGIYNLFHNFF